MKIKDIKQAQPYYGDSTVKIEVEDDMGTIQHYSLASEQQVTDVQNNVMSEQHKNMDIQNFFSMVNFDYKECDCCGAVGATIAKNKTSINMCCVCLLDVVEKGVDHKIKVKKILGVKDDRRKT